MLKGRLIYFLLFFYLYINFRAVKNIIVLTFYTTKLPFPHHFPSHTTSCLNSMCCENNNVKIMKENQFLYSILIRYKNKSAMENNVWSCGFSWVFVRKIETKTRQEYLHIRTTSQLSSHVSKSSRRFPLWLVRFFPAKQNSRTFISSTV